LRSPIYAHHDPLIPEEDGEYTFIDQGIQRFEYSLLPHEGSWEDGETAKRAAELNCKPISIIETFHKGSLPQTDSYVNVNGANHVLISAIKKAEDNDDLIIRAYETNKVPAEVEITLPKFYRSFKASFKPSEIKTFRIPKDSEKPIRETNLIEWDE
jgi:alpha-mannosidase